MTAQPCQGRNRGGAHRSHFVPNRRPTLIGTETRSTPLVTSVTLLSRKTRVLPSPTRNATPAPTPNPTFVSDEGVTPGAENLTLYSPTPASTYGRIRSAVLPNA